MRQMVLMSALLLASIPVSASVVEVAQVNLNDSATLHCAPVQQCTGKVEWTRVASKEVVAQYSQSICTSERGYELSSEKILAGDLSLTVTSADFSKKGWYTCACNGRDVCIASLRIKSHSVPVWIKPSEPLNLELPIREPVEVIFNSTGAAGSSSKQICTVDGRSLLCSPEYKHRVSLVCAVQVKEMTPPDDGIYIIKDTKNKESISILSVTVQGEPPLPVGHDCRECTGKLVALVMLLVVVIGASIIIYLQWREINKLRGNPLA